MSGTAESDDLEQLRRAAPFDSLPERSLLDVAPALTRHALEAGTLVIAEDTDPENSPLFTILSGRVRIVETEQRSTVRHLRPGQLFGHFALLRRLPPPYRAEISQAGELIEIDAAAMRTLFARHPFFTAWFHADLRRFERELGAFDDVAGSRFLFGQRLRDLEHSTPPACDASRPLHEVARTMSEHDSDCAVITEEGRAIGLLSDADLRARLVAARLPDSSAARDILSGTLPSVRADASVFDGMMAMEEHGRRHVALLDGAGEFRGVLSDTDLARTLLSSPAALRRRLHQADTGAALRTLRTAADRMIVTLHRRGVRTEDLLKINTRFNDALTVRTLELARRRLAGPPPERLRWSWLSLGSEGRGEMGLRTDQDNAIVYECPAPEAADDWLGQLAHHANGLLGEAGIALCDGGIMAREPPMRRSLAAWRGAVDEWLADADDVRQLWIGALSDCRVVTGDAALGGALQRMLLTALRENPAALRALAREALVPDVPLRRFPGRRLRGTDREEGPSLHLKRQGTHMIVNAARLLALEAGWLERSGTLERLAAVGEREPSLSSTVREAEVAYGVLADLRLSWQVEQTERGEPMSDVMPIERIGETRKRLLISAYETVEDIRFRVRARFGMGR